MFDEFCQNHCKGSELYCERVNTSAPPAFCHFMCFGEWRKFRKENTEVLRKKYRPPLTEEEKGDKDLVSVIIPCAEPDKKYLKRTIEHIKQNAVGPLEIIVICDGWPGNGYGDITIVCKLRGQRWAMNEAAKQAKGKYLFRLDAHCNMSEGWDARIKASCGKDTVVTATFDALDIETWQGLNRDNGFVRLTPHLLTRFVRGWKTFGEREIEEETMGISGTAWMILRDYYWQLDGCDESLGEYGAIGSEWSLKVWLTGGRCVIRTDVVCYHLFRKITPFDVKKGEEQAAYEKLERQWIIGEDSRIKRPMGWLVCKFNHYLRKRVYTQF